MEFQVGQLDMKIAFLHGDLEEKIYMEQPKGFEVARKEHLISLQIEQELVWLEAASSLAVIQKV